MANKIRNFKALAVTGLRRDALDVIGAGLEAIDTPAVVKSSVSLTGDEFQVADRAFSLAEVNKLYVVGAGKCVLEAAEVIETILGERLTGGLVIDVSVPQGHKFQRIKCVEGTHPVPSPVNMKAAGEIVELLEGLGEKDLVIFVISGGGSSLLCLPALPSGPGGADRDGACENEARIFKTLSAAGADIEEINTVRKHTSLARGGFLAWYAYPARVVSIIFSDVPGDELGLVASGPTVRDNTTVADAEEVIKKYKVLERSGLDAVKLIETPKESKYFKKVDNVMLISNRRALDAMRTKAEALGYQARVCTTCLTGEARETAGDIVKELRGEAPKTALLYGGETTVTVKVKGEGGRNRELALAALLSVGRGEAVIPVASDGRDNGDHAGGIADEITLQHAKNKQLDVKWHLEHNQSAKFFSETGDFIMTGDTGSNVSDLTVAIKD